MTSSSTPGPYSRDHSGARPHAGRIREDQKAAGWTRADNHGTRHLQRDVERALLLQVFTRTSETAADAQPPGGARAGRERGHYRHWRRLGLRLQDRVAQSSIVYRAVSGRGYGCRRNFAGYFHHGRAAGGRNGFAALRTDSGWRWRWAGILARQCRCQHERRSRLHRKIFTRINPCWRAW